jgi:putative hydrolase of the HAD superfamily
VIRGIVFDLFDTLVDQDASRLAFVEHEGRQLSPSTVRLHAHLTRSGSHGISLGDFAREQHEVDRELRAETLDRDLELPTLRRFEALAERLGLAEHDGLAQAWTRIHMEVLRGALVIPTHHEAVLASLALEYRLALCSNFSHGETARAILAESGLDRHLSSIVVSEEVGFRKPRSEIFACVAESLGIAPREVLHVGDDLRADVGGAARAGMRTVWLTRRIRDPEAVLAAHDGPRPDFALEDLLDLPVLVARLAGFSGSSRAG